MTFLQRVAIFASLHTSIATSEAIGGFRWELDGKPRSEEKPLLDTHSENGRSVCASEEDCPSAIFKEEKTDDSDFFDQFLRERKSEPLVNDNAAVVPPVKSKNSSATEDTEATVAAESDNDECQDENEKCAQWAAKGECEKNPNYMMISCKMSCLACKDETSSSGVDIGVKQKVTGSRSMETLDRIRKTEAYVRHVLVQPEYESVRSGCKNLHELCSFWAVLGECEKNPTYMATDCAPACQICADFDVKARCPLDPNAKDAWGPGDLSKTFERIISDENSAKYSPIVVSRPSLPAGMVKEEARFYIGGPWVIALSDFLSPEECDRLIDLGAMMGYARSKTIDATSASLMKADDTHKGSQTEGRTSENTWCLKQCRADPIAQRVMERIANLTGTPESNSEYLQLVKYKEGQYYKTHTDYIPHQIDRQPGVRILTVFLYLNDVGGGGATNFPSLGINVMPKRGRALIWPSVLDEDPNQKDSRTVHQALPVTNGIKYGANAWIHMRDFRGPYENSCHY